MANTKISALTSATTPLAGTEVLPIVQSGATKQVSVANLTAGRDTAALSLSLNSAPNRDTLNVAFKQMFYNTAGDGNANTVIGQLRSQVRNYGTNIPTASFATIQFATDPSAWFKGEIRFLTNGTDGTDGVGTLASKIDSAQNYVPSIAGKGINYTANTPAAGMTSQLLNWYEEGTWTPNQGSGLTVIGTFSATGRYTRIGRLVTVQGSVGATTSVAVTAGGIISTNLPFTASGVAYQPGSSCNDAVTAGGQVMVFNGSTTVYSVTALGATPRIYFSASYTVA